jgi:hypothetical protein
MNERRRPSFMPEVREFSQADPRVVQRPEGIDALGTNPVTVRDVENGTRERYSDLQVSPGSWWESWLFTNVSTKIAGLTVLCDSPLGFPAHSVLVDNWTNQWIRIDGVRRVIGPYSGGWVLNNMSGMQTARVELQTPSPQITQPAVIAGEYVWVGFAEALLQPATGYSVPGIAGTPGAIGSPIFVDTVGQTNRTYITASSGNQANVAAVATLAGAAGVRTWITGFECTALGATAVNTVLVTITGLVTGTLTYVFQFPAGATVPATTLNVQFTTPIPSSAVNTSIVVTLPASGAGGTNAVTNAHGFLE